jgi:hypothetical protein
MTNRSATPHLARDGHVWMHANCHADWMKRRRETAIMALTALGVTLKKMAIAPPDDIGAGSPRL